MFPYLEATMVDTAIENVDVWRDLSESTFLIEKSRDLVTRMDARVERLSKFLDYLEAIETEALKDADELQSLRVTPLIRKVAMMEAARAQTQTRRYYSEKE